VWWFVADEMFSDALFIVENALLAGDSYGSRYCESKSPLEEVSNCFLVNFINSPAAISAIEAYAKRVNKEVTDYLKTELLWQLREELKFSERHDRRDNTVFCRRLDSE
jgi:hypothetical protein